MIFIISQLGFPVWRGCKAKNIWSLSKFYYTKKLSVWEYQKSKHAKVCCGECKQMYKPAQTWQSKDNCIQTSDRLVMSSSSQVCPKIYCNKEHLYFDGYCQRCNYTGLVKTNCIMYHGNVTYVEPIQSSIKVKVLDCMTKVFNLTDAIGKIREKDKDSGLCKNLKPVKGLAKCTGSCQSSTDYHDIWKPMSECSRCQPMDNKIILVELTCDNGKKLKKEMTVPAKCSCRVCGSAKNDSKRQTVIHMLQKS